MSSSLSFPLTVGQSASAPSAISSANPSASATARAIPDRETLPAQEIRGSSRDAYQTPVGQDGLRVTPLTEADAHEDHREVPIKRPLGERGSPKTTRVVPLHPDYD